MLWFCCIQISFIIPIVRGSILEFHCISDSKYVYNIYTAVNYWTGPGTTLFCYSAVTEGCYHFKQTSLNYVNNSRKCAQACENITGSLPENNMKKKDEINKKLFWNLTARASM